jgi:hypothetical protein
MFENTAQASFSFTYLNPNEFSIEKIELEFPCDPKMAISDIILEIGNKTFHSEALEISKNYTKHPKSHETVLLAHRRDFDSLIIPLPVLPAGQTATIRLTGVTVLPPLFNAQHKRWYSRYILPLTFISSDFQQSAVDYSFHFSFSAPYASSVSCSSYSDITIESPTRISYFGLLKRDLIVDVIYPEIPQPIIERYNKTQLTQFLFNDLTLPDPINLVNPSIIFLVDRSRWMSGSAIANIRIALSLFVHSLPADCEFDIVDFGSTFSSLFKGKRGYSDQTLKTAIAYVKGITANMGETEILPPLKYILEEIRPQFLFFLTNGDVWNIQEILNFVEKHQTKISTFKMRYSRSFHLPRRIAESTNGSYEVIVKESEIEEAVIRSLSDTLKGVIGKVNVESNCGVSYDRIPRFFSRTSLERFTFFSPFEIGQCDMKLKGFFSNGMEFERVLNSADGHLIYSKILHSAFVIERSESGIMNSDTRIAFARELNLVT